MKSSGEEKLSRDSVMNATCTNPAVHCFTHSQSRGAHRGIGATVHLGWFDSSQGADSQNASLRPVYDAAGVQEMQATRDVERN